MEVVAPAKITLHVTSKASQYSPSGKSVEQAIEDDIVSPLSTPDSFNLSSEVGVSTTEHMRTPRLILKTGKRPTDEVDINTSPTKRKKKRGRRQTFAAYQDSSSDENYNPETQTRSGRNIITPNSQRRASAPVPVSNRDKPARWPVNPADMSCVVCQRIPDTPENQMVFCDGCDSPYHQTCHRPVIDNSFVREADKKWFCSNCPRMSVENAVPVVAAKRGRKPKTGRKGAYQPKVISFEQKLSYLQSLDSGELVSIILAYDQNLQRLPIPDSTISQAITSGQRSSPFSAPIKRQNTVGTGTENIVTDVMIIDENNTNTAQLPKQELVEDNNDDDSLWQDDPGNPGVSHRVNGIPVNVPKTEATPSSDLVPQN